MKPDVKIEIIYYGAAADWSFESGFYSKEYALRLLTQTAANPSAFLKALDRAVSRSAVILAVGDLQDAGRTGLCSLLSRALGMDYPPDGGLPPEAAAFDAVDARRGGWLQSGEQAIFLMHSEKDYRDETLHSYIFPALSARFSVAIGGCPVPEPAGNPTAEETEPVPAEAVETPVQEPAQATVSEPAHAAVTPVAVAGGRRRLSVRMKRVEPVAVPAAIPVPEPVLVPAPPLPVERGEAPAQPEEVPAPMKMPVLETATEAGPVPESEPLPCEATPVFPANVPTEAGAAVPAEDAPEPAQADEAVFFGFDAYEAAGKKPKKKVAVALLCIVLGLCLVAGGCFGYLYWYQPWQTDRVYARMSGLYGQNGSENLPDKALAKFGGLYDLNADIAGWLTLPNTAVDYPVTAVNQRSADYYESHLPDGTWNRSGSLYTGCVPYPDGYYRNMTIYGKDTGDGRMFSDLRRYLELDFYKSSPLITMDTLYTKGQWKIFSVFEAAGEDPLDYNQSAFSDDTAFLTYIAALSDRSAIRTMVDLRADDEILTLVAKGRDSNVVLAARRVRTGESTLVNVTGALENPAPTPVTQSVNQSSEALLLRFGLLTAGAAEPDAPYMSDPAAASDSAPQDEPAADSPAGASSSPVSSAPDAQPSADPPPYEEPEPTPPPADYPAVNPPAGEELTLTVRNQYDSNRLVTSNASDIVAQIVEAEMGSAYQLEALKAQAVAAYSWLLCNGAADGKNPQVYLKTPSAKTLEAVAATAGQRVLYNGAVACAFYYDTSAGRTALPSDIWEGGNQPYLASVESPLDRNNSRFETTVTYRAADVAVWVKDAYGVDLSDVDKSNWFQVTYDDYGVYARRVLIGGKVWVKGPSLRNTLFTSARVGSGKGLRSSAYAVSYDPGGDAFTFTVRGYGHGVGMSQTGANEYAKQGWDYRQILQHYFTGVTIG